MFKNKTLVKFVAESKEFLEVSILDEKILPKSSAQNNPVWYKNTPSYVNDKKGIDSYSDPNSTIKMCMPVSDSMKAGYTIPLPCDIWIFNEGENKIRFQWAWENLNLISEQRSDQHSLYPIPDGFYSKVFKWLNHWIVSTPKGYNCLFTHPLHHDDLPFKCLSSIVSTDKYPAPVHFPFFLRKDFSGLIEKGTPLIQVIPFKRETFKSKFTYDKGGKLEKIWKAAHNSFFNRYSENFRETSKYENGEAKISKCPFGFS